MSSDARSERAPSLISWVLRVGGAGFAAGFAGPIVLLPDANTGPMIGLFITGPGGALLGLTIGVICHVIGVEPSLQRRLMNRIAVAAAVSTLIFCLFAPEPRARGAVIDAVIKRCIPADELADAGIAYWQQRIDKVTWAKPRAGWKEGVPDLLRNDAGVVLELQTVRKNPLFEQRKLWNRGRIRAAGWQSDSTVQTYYARQAGRSCGAYRLGERGQYLPRDEPSSDWPPATASGILNLLLLEPVPSAYQALIQ